MSMKNVHLLLFKYIQKFIVVRAAESNILPRIDIMQMPASTQTEPENKIKTINMLKEYLLL